MAKVTNGLGLAFSGNGKYWGAVVDVID